MLNVSEVITRTTKHTKLSEPPWIRPCTKLSEQLHNPIQIKERGTKRGIIVTHKYMSAHCHDLVQALK
jgi:hypothetical protein